MEEEEIGREMKFLDGQLSNLERYGVSLVGGM